MESSGGSGLAYSFNVLAWLCMSLTIALALYKISAEKTWVISWFEYGLLAVLLCLLVPFFYSAEYSDFAIPRFIGAVVTVAFIIALHQFDVWQKKSPLLLVLILVAVSIQAAVGIFQMSLTEYFTPLHFDPLLNRAYGLFFQPNVMASFIATGLAICCYLLAIKQQLAKKWLSLLLLLLAAFTVLLTDLLSLTGRYGAIAALIFITPLLIKCSIKRSLICYVVIIVAVFTTLYVNQQNEQPSYIKNEQRSVNVRKTIYSVSTKLWLTSPITGVGYGHFEREYLDFHNQLKVKQPTLAEPLINLSHPHNEPLLWIIEGGVMPLLGFLILLCLFARLMMISKNKYQALACFGLLIPIAFHTQTEMPFYSSTPHLLVFAMLIVYIAKQLLTENIVHASESYPQRLLKLNGYKNYSVNWHSSATLTASIIVLVSSSFLLTTLHTNYIVTQYEKSSVQTLDKLTKVINPLPWRSKIEALVHHNMLYSGVKNKNIEKVKSYATWAEQRLKRKPRKALYEQLLLCYQLLGNEENYQRVLQEAKATYPLVNHWSITSKNYGKK
ncbi:Wzy polymerase domain-containing protein [Thalassotalea sp. 1_MG-2023]|uniref:PglL family O-oligosaccharyltransferase n=1 Tax=Thalassotalea sp. 1_MG-2023 TaxID=3062680 RepID=UPI0026E1A57F|nr:Wzy polymerase domain-containing protein [Thalassotalea sp. 1_MG-2023]MDO6426298.1 Wzy polymerase domain-containing protein [Thalassotalea sp. 1_MG-2023]